MAKSSTGASTAARLQELVRDLGDYGHVSVRARGTQLLIGTQDAEGVLEVLARASPLGASQYALAFRNHTGRWDPLPVQGTLGEVAQGLVELLGPYLSPDNFT